MSKGISVPLKAHYALGTTTISRQWRFDRRDGTVHCFTNCSRDLLINGEVYSAEYGPKPTTIEQGDDGALTNSEINSFLSDEVNESDVEAGLWDGCFVTVFEVNYRDLSQGVLRLQGGTIGVVQAGRMALKAEVIGIEQRLQKVTGFTVTPGCPWAFGGPECGVDAQSMAVTSAITSASGRRTFMDTARTEANDWFGGGVITFTDGPNAGVSLEVYAYDGTTKTITTYLPVPRNPGPTDGYTMTPGCRKRWIEDCNNKYGNGNNFGGFPDLPGADKILGMGGTEGLPS